jgi:hypothetical protein
MSGDTWLKWTDGHGRPLGLGLGWVPVCLEPDHLPPAPTEKWRLAAAEAAEEAAAARSPANSMA